MPNDYDPEDWRSTPSCPVHFSPLTVDGGCLQCRSLESIFKISRDITQPFPMLEPDEDEDDYEQP
jgi:hypothetical protein